MTDTLLVVTGGSAGIGRALAAAAPAGARIVDISRSGADLADRHVAADLADPASWGAVADAVDEEVARSDARRVTFVHAAGVLDPMGFAGEVDTEAYVANVLLNSAAGQVLGHRFLAAVADRAELRRELVLISSGAASTPYPGWAAYGAGKAALDQWVRSVGLEQRERGGVVVCAIAPGVVATGMQERIREMDPHDFPRVERFRELHAEGGLRDVDTVARQLWDVLDRGVETGSVLDLRQL
ncbi:MAG: SDR family NAD(P)-dependent oxidoreductase [Actinobacteria bacterium]|nr:SDR family NAD(P)-dependent oxidoreductase [Actinomycetota bacterium]